MKSIFKILSQYYNDLKNVFDVFIDLIFICIDLILNAHIKSIFLIYFFNGLMIINMYLNLLLDLVRIFNLLSDEIHL